MQIVPMRDLKDTVRIEAMCEQTHEPVFVTKNGYGRLVVMDMESYERLIKDAYEASMLNQALDDLKSGSYRDGKNVMEGIKSKYGL